MKALDRLRELVGLGTGRDRPIPQLELVTDGLVITDTTATAWFTLGTKNTDTLPEDERDDDLASVISTVPPLLGDRWCHTKIVWGREDGNAYIADLETPTEWDDLRADWLDSYDLPQRHVLLGVILDDNRQAPLSAAARQKGVSALGLPPGKVDDRELRMRHEEARSLKTALNATPWDVQLASADELAWVMSREMHRDTPTPTAGTITGAGLQMLTNGRIEPHVDHLQAIDTQGRPSRYMAVLALAEFPETITTPGPQEWLRTLAMIQRVSPDGETVPVVADASVRWRTYTASKARKRVDNARALAKEQRQSAAKHSAGDVPDQVAETEQLMSETMTALDREGLQMVQCHARILLSEDTYEDLQEAIKATQTHFARIGITALHAVDEQRELWLEQLISDGARVTDLGQELDAEAFFGAWWWGGSAVGDLPGMGTRAIGWLTGSTPGLVRLSINSGSRRGDSTTTGYIAKSGRGKTTAMMFQELDAVVDGNTWISHLSTKGDDLAMVEVAKHYGVPAATITVGHQHSGAADLFRSLDPGEAILAVHRQIELLAPPHLATVAQGLALNVVQQHASIDRPTTWGVIQLLCQHHDEDAKELGAFLESLAQTPLGAAILGPPSGEDTLPTQPGLWVLHLPGLTLPETGQAEMDVTERVSLAALRAFLQHSLWMMKTPQLRKLSKVVAVPEAWALLMTQDGANFLANIAKVGRALNGNLLLDLQSASLIQADSALHEQLSNVIVGQLTSGAEQDDAARLLGLPVGPSTRSAIHRLGIGPSREDPVRHGHFMIRDSRGDVATVQVQAPSDEILAWLSTNPDDAQPTAQDREEWDAWATKDDADEEEVA